MYLEGLPHQPRGDRFGGVALEKLHHRLDDALPSEARWPSRCHVYSDLCWSAAVYPCPWPRSGAPAGGVPGPDRPSNDGTRLLLDRGAPSALHYFAVDDIEAVVNRLRAAGVVIETEPHVIFSHADDSLGPAGTAEWQAFIRDSEGNLVGLVEQRPEG